MSYHYSYVWDIQITNILECHMYRISKSQIFQNVICMEYPNHKYFQNVICMGYLNHKDLYQGYSMDILFQSTWGPCREPCCTGRHCPLCTILCGIQLKVQLFLSKIVTTDDLFFNSRSKSNVPSVAPIYRITNCIHTMICLFGFTNRVENEEKANF